MQINAIRLFRLNPQKFLIGVIVTELHSRSGMNEEDYKKCKNVQFHLIVKKTLIKLLFSLRAFKGHARVR